MAESEITILKRQIEELRTENKRLKEENQEVERLRAEIARLKQDNQCNEVKEAMHKLQVALKPRIFRMDDLVGNPGLKHIALQIFKGLDLKSHGNCRLVSKKWKDCIDNNKWWWKQQIARCRYYLSIIEDQILDQAVKKRESVKEFSKALKYVSKEESLANLQLFTLFMRDYFFKFKPKIGGCYEKGKDPSWYIPTPLSFGAKRNRSDVFQACARSPMKNFNVDTYYEILNPERSNFDILSSIKTILGEACINNQTEIVEFYMNLKGDRRVDFNQLHQGNETLFHEACKSNKVEVVKLFLDRAEELNINLNARNGKGITPMMRVFSKDVMQILLSDDRIDGTIIDADGCNVLHHICKNNDGNGHADPLSPSCFFERYSKEQNIVSVCNILQQAIEVTEEKITDTITLLLQSSKIPFIRDTEWGFTPLHHVCYTQRPNEQRIDAMLNVLMGKSIDVNEVNNHGETAVHIAFEMAFGFGTRKEILQEKPHYLTTLPPTISVFLKFAKRMGINFEAVDNDGKTPLHRLCESIRGLVGKEEYIDNFLKLAKMQYGIEFNLKATDRDGKTPMELLH